MINQMQHNINEKQKLLQQEIKKKHQKEQDFKDGVLRLLNEINEKLK